VNMPTWRRLKIDKTIGSGFLLTMKQLYAARWYPSSVLPGARQVEVQLS
jgi:hypothetical protein